jgi:MYXO-CTERM domain-containing protein
MNDRRRALLFVAVALGSLAPSVASASYPAGVWGLVEKVTPEPDDKNPNRVRIDGLFMVAGVKPDFAGYPGYSVPVYGYMYYQCEDAQLATCQMEWAELATVASSDDRCRGWGDSSLPANGSVRTAEPQAQPDSYPISMGVVPGFTPCDALKNWMAENPPQGATTGEGTGEGTSAGESSGEFASEGSSSQDGSSESGSASSATGETTASPTSGGTSSGSASETGQGESGASGQADTGSLGGDKGCACSEGGEPRPLAALWIVVGLLALRRRVRA